MLCRLLILTLYALRGACAMTIATRNIAKESARSLFYHGFNNYMFNAFPEDELQPLTCDGRGRDRSDESNLGINDICGDYALTLIDSLDMLPLLGDQDGFERGVQNVIDTVSFDVDSKIQVFEATIRILGGLLSAHQFATIPQLNSTILWYDDELLYLALDLADRLLPAFDSPTGIPYPRINLKYGLKSLNSADTTETCSAGAGSLVLEFALLSRLSGSSKYELAATRAFKAVWDRRLELGLVGNTIDAQTGSWISSFTGIGAGVDSFYEYALKTWIFLDDQYFYDVWQQSYKSIKLYVADEDGYFYRNVHLRTGIQISNYVDSLTAFYSGLLVLAGKVEEAIKSHMIYHSLWTRYQGLPERFNFNSLQIEMPWYPLRPEFIESTYFLYRATKDPFYLSVGQQVLQDLLQMKQACGFAGLANVVSRKYDNRMESFMLSETLKYLYLLFDEAHPLNHIHSNWVFTTEGHPLFLTSVMSQTAQHKNMSIARTSDYCEVPERSDFFSAIMTRDDLDQSHTKVGLVGDGRILPDYFPPVNSAKACKSFRVRNEIEVLFGAMAYSVINASASIVQMGKDLMIKSLLGLKIRFSVEQNSFRAVKVNHQLLADDSTVYVSDPDYERYTTENLVHFATRLTDVELEVITASQGKIYLSGVSSLYGSILPDSTTPYELYSLLDTSNSDGCLCPAINRKSNQNSTADTSVVVVYRGGCSFFQKSLNAKDTAKLVVVIDTDEATRSIVRPSLLDDLGTPMSASAGYPSLVLVPAISDTTRWQDGNKMIVRYSEGQSEQMRLHIQGRVVHNVEFLET